MGKDFAKVFLNQTHSRLKSLQEGKGTILQPREEATQADTLEEQRPGLRATALALVPGSGNWSDNRARVAGARPQRVLSHQELDFVFF